MIVKHAKTRAQIIAQSPTTEFNETLPNLSVAKYAVSSEGKIILVRTKLVIITTKMGAKSNGKAWTRSGQCTVIAMDFNMIAITFFRICFGNTLI